MKSLIRKWLMGDSVFSAYVKVTAPDDLPQRVWLEADVSIMDVSDKHWLLCIDPLVFGVWIPKNLTGGSPLENISFTLYFGGIITSEKKSINNAESIVHLALVDRIQGEHGTLLLLRTMESHIYQLSFIKRFLIFSRYYKKDGLRYGRFKSFVSAYSYPRRIRIISFRQGDYYNIFPMDLLGEMKDGGHYVFGLRHTNIALSKIIECGKISVCEVSFKYKDIIYDLGKHHSGSPPSMESIGFETIPSKNFEFPIPVWVQDYKEIRILKTVNMGSHMLLWGQLIEETRLTHSSDHLYLVHFLHYLHQKHQGNAYALA